MFDITIFKGTAVVKTMGATTLAAAQSEAWEQIRMDEFGMGYRISEVVPPRTKGDRCAKLVDVSHERYASPMERFSLEMNRQ